MQANKISAFAIVTAISLAVTGCGDGAETQGKTASGKGSVATITFDNGEVLTTKVICALETQISAGQEILYTATSLSNPYFDITVFGEKSSFPGAKASWNETKDFEVYQESWSTQNIPGQSTFSPVLDGNTITGNATMVRGEDETGQANETRQAEIVVNCEG